MTLKLCLAATFENFQNLPCFRVFYLPKSIQQTLVSTKMLAVRAVSLLVTILRCPSFDICRN